MALKTKTGEYIFNEETNPTRRPTISWNAAGACGPSAEPDWQGVPANEADQNNSTNIGIGMAELIYLKIHPLISPGIDAMDDDLPTFEEAGDGNVDQYMTDEWDMIIYDDEGNPVPNPQYGGGMTMQEWEQMNAKSQQDQIVAKQFWVDMSMAIAEGVIEHIKLEHNNPLHQVIEGQPGDGSGGVGLETDEITERTLSCLQTHVAGSSIGLESMTAIMSQMSFASQLSHSSLKTFAETAGGNSIKQALSAGAQITVWGNLFTLLDQTYSALATAFNTVVPGSGTVFQGFMTSFLTTNEVLLLGALGAEQSAANDLDEACATLATEMEARRVNFSSFQNIHIPAIIDQIQALDYNSSSKVK